MLAAVRPARSASAGVQRSRSTRSGGSPPAAERWAVSAATVVAPAPAASDQKPTRFPRRSAAGRAGTSGVSGSARPVASRISASATVATGEASSIDLKRLKRKATARARRLSRTRDVPAVRRSLPHRTRSGAEPAALRPTAARRACSRRDAASRSPRHRRAEDPEQERGPPSVVAFATSCRAAASSPSRARGRGRERDRARAPPAGAA